MNYTTSDMLDFVYTIPTKHRDFSLVTNYHLEIKSLSSGVVKQYPATSVEPATEIATGTVTFSDIAILNTGLHNVSLFYADNADLNAGGVKITKLTTTTFQKVSSINQISL